MDSIPIEIIHLIYSRLFFPRDIIGFMLTCKHANAIDLNTRQILLTWKNMYRVHKDILLIKQFILPNWIHDDIECSLRITSKVTHYRYVHYNQSSDDCSSYVDDGPSLRIITDTNDCVIMEDAFGLNIVDIFNRTPYRLGLNCSIDKISSHEEIATCMRERNILNSIIYQI